MRRVTLDDVAKRLKISRSTVCRGLKNHPNTSEQTRRRVREACRELGYRPDPVLSELGRSRWQTARVAKGTVIAYLLCSGPGLELVSAMEEEADQLGYRLEVFHREDFRSSSKLQSVLLSRGIRDIILGTTFERSQTIELDWKNFVTVQLLPGFFPLPFHSVVRDHFNVVVMAWQKAVERGYQRIGIVLLQHTLPLIDDILRLSGAHACQRFLFPGLPAIPPLLYPQLNDDHHRENFVRWVEKNDPDVIIGFSSVEAGLYRSQFGRDTPFICLHNTPPTPLSGIHDAPSTYAREAISLLNFCRRSHQWGIPKQRVDHVLEPTWVEGNSWPIKGS